MTPFTDEAVEKAFHDFPESCRHPLLLIRQLVIETAANLPAIGTLSESLKWQQPSYSTSKKAGSPFRLGTFEGEQLAVFFHCQTTLVESFKGLFGDRLRFSGNRAIVLDPKGPLPISELTFCIESALTYHLHANKR